MSRRSNQVLLLMLALLAIALFVAARTQEPSAQAPQQPKPDDPDSAHVMHSMGNRHMEMGPHMKMTSLREPKSGDQERADEVVQTTRKTLEKFKDYRVALKDGYRIFLPKVPQKMYHFTNYWYGFEAGFRFNTEHPTSLLYEKDGDGYRLIGAMYTAPEKATEEELDERIPLSVAQWHLHVNFCFPTPERKAEMFLPHPKFGFAGSISTRDECEKAGGKFVPQLFGWMIHVYPFEKNSEDVWAVERHSSSGHNHAH